MSCKSHRYQRSEKGIISTFESEDIVPESCCGWFRCWNVPSADVWSYCCSDVAQKRKWRPALWLVFNQLYFALFFLFLLASASFLTILAIAVDRYLAVSLHLRYQELVTTNRIVLALISLWVTSVVTAALFVSLPNNNHLVVVIVEAVGFPVTTIAYIRIYMAVRYHQNRINSQMREGGHRLKVSIREQRAAINSLFFYVIFLACYTPHLCGTILLLTDSTSISYLVANHATLLLVILNSALNPLVYCWRYRQIRVYAINTIRKLLISRDSE